MGFSPQQVDQMTLFQFAACVDGYNASQGKREADPPSDEEFAEAKMLHGDD